MGFFDQSEHAQGPIYVINIYIYIHLLSQIYSQYFLKFKEILTIARKHFIFRVYFFVTLHEPC